MKVHRMITYNINNIYIYIYIYICIYTYVCKYIIGAVKKVTILVPVKF